MNPYRKAFYEHQYEWHGYQGARDIERRHANRSKYYKWYTQDWLPESRATKILDIGCGSGQFLYFLREQGYTDAVGIDLDQAQVVAGRELGLNTVRADVATFLAEDEGKRYGLIAVLDILEHFTREELYPFLCAVADKLEPGGKLIASVPNADSPEAARAIYADITHEIAFTPTSLGEMFFCHGLRLAALRDPWPAPVSPLRAAYRLVSTIMRKVEVVRLGLLGFSAPKYWSSVIWVLAEKPKTRDEK
jgi:2-polyprenyl-3-methyl-5-hydroxy-6-metoxy-1,4-benzoquinol methylase